MPKTLYRYNAETCQYERVKVKIFDVVFYISGLLVTSILILAAILVAHDYLIDSEKEVRLRNENAALKTNQIVLTSQLYDIETKLDSLAMDDQALHQKFFNSPVDAPAPRAATADKRTLLLGGTASFSETAKKVDALTRDLLTTSRNSNIGFRKLSRSNKLQPSNLAIIPLASPVGSLQPDQIVSGFGMRINPFHKGLYEHYGLDFTLPRGTPVTSTADGVVVEAKRNIVQAGYGNYVEVRHQEGFVTRYAHLDEIAVRAGQKISKGAVIGLSGNSGGSIAPHLHYEVILNGSQVDPVQYIIERLSSADHALIVSRAQKQNQSLD